MTKLRSSLRSYITVYELEISSKNTVQRPSGTATLAFVGIHTLSCSHNKSNMPKELERHSYWAIESYKLQYVQKNNPG